MADNQVNTVFTGDASDAVSAAKTTAESLDGVRESAKQAGEDGSESLGLLSDILDDLSSLVDSVVEGFSNMAGEIGNGIREGIQTAEQRVEQATGAIGSHLKSMAENVAATTATFYLFGAEAAGVVGAVLAGVSLLALAYKGLSFAVGLLTGSSYKSSDIDALIAQNNAVKELQDSLQLSAADANALNDALQRLGVNKADITAVTNAVQTAIHGNTDELDRLGVAYKDANGQMLDNYTIVQNAKNVLAEYTAGWDRNQAATAMGIGSYAQITSYLKITQQEMQQSKARLDEFNLGLGPESQAAIAAYSSAMLEFNNESRLMSEGFSRAIADNIMPALTDLALFFKDGWPVAVNAFRYSMAEITSLLWGLEMSWNGAIDTFKLGAGLIKDLLMSVAKASVQALTGDFTGAANTMAQGWASAKDRIHKTQAEIVADAQHAAAAMKLAWAFDDRKDSNAGKPKKGKKWEPPKADDTDDGEKGHDDSQLWAEAHQKYLEYLRAFTATRMELVKTAAQLELELNQESYDSGVISLQSYLDTKQRLTEQAIQAEIDLKKKEEATLTTDVATYSKSNDAKGASKYHETLLKLEEAKKELIELESQLTMTQQKGNAEAEKAASQEQALAFDNQQKLAAISEAGVEQNLANLGRERDALAAHYQWQQEQLDAQNAYDQQSDILTQDAKLAKQREYEQKSLELQQQANQAMLPYTDMSAGWTKGFNTYLDQMQQTFKQGETLAQQTAQGMTQSFSTFFFNAMQGKMNSLASYITSFLTSVERAIANVLGQQMTGGIMGGLGSMFGLGSSPGAAATPTIPGVTMAAAHGMAFDHKDRVRKYASGDVFYQPTLFGTGSGLGVLGEAGPEAVMPLTRTADGGLGVKTTGSTQGGGTQVNVEVNMINQSGNQLSATQSGSAYFDGQQWVINVVVDNISSGGILRQMMQPQ